MSISHEIFKFCRLCQSKLGVNSILQDNLINKILECTKIHLKEDELLNSELHKICDDCKEVINTFYTFLQNIYKVDNAFKQKVQEFREKLDQADVRREVIKVQNVSVDNVFTLNNDIKTCMEAKEETANQNKSNNEKVDKRALLIRKKSCTCIGDCHCKFSEKHYICEWGDCNKVCSSAYTFKTHRMKHENRRPFLCATCGKGFITKNSLNCHEKIHLDVKSYNCELCKISFSVKSNLRAHEKKYHEGVKFYCTQCTKAYISKASLERHERLHTGIKEYQCKSCSSAFYTKEELVKHQKYHKGLRQHKCSECYKTFFEKHHLTIHLRSHTGEKPYSCTVTDCGKSFAESQKLTRHMKAKHPY